MKIFMLVSVIFVSCRSFSQTLHFEENFDYPTGDLLTDSTDWFAAPSGNVPVQVIDGNLVYPDYISSSAGRMIALDGGASGRQGVGRSFTETTGDGSAVYASFLLNVTSTDDMATNTSDGEYFANFGTGSTYRNRIHVRKGSDTSKYSIGLAKSSTSSLTWYNNELLINTTYLIVTSYHFRSGTSNDELRLWINPPLNGSIPAEDIFITSGTDASSLDFFRFRQEALSGDMQIDGLRISDNWEQAPLPVELTSFYSTLAGNSIILRWRTESEINNYGFDVERIAPLNNSWETIGFVQGHGFTHVPQDYTFKDDNLNTEGVYLYRLKQIDNDGRFEYSDAIEVNFYVPDEFTLEQNFPNPFNPSTTIKYSLGKESDVTLKIYDILGNEVAELVNERQAAGVYYISFNTKDFYKLDSQVYFYVLKTGAFIKTRKMLLLQ